jgi:hypothetical protein
MYRLSVQMKKSRPGDLASRLSQLRWMIFGDHFHRSPPSRPHLGYQRMLSETKRWKLRLARSGQVSIRKPDCQRGQNTNYKWELARRHSLPLRKGLSLARARLDRKQFLCRPGFDLIEEEIAEVWTFARRLVYRYGRGLTSKRKSGPLKRRCEQAGLVRCAIARLNRLWIALWPGCGPATKIVPGFTFIIHFGHHLCPRRARAGRDRPHL